MSKPKRNLKFIPKMLADQYLCMGGLVDANGNLFREKDVLEEDFSEPILYGNEEYIIISTKKISQKLIGVFLEKGTTLILSNAEYDEAVVSA